MSEAVAESQTRHSQIHAPLALGTTVSLVRTMSVADTRRQDMRSSPGAQCLSLAMRTRDSLFHKLLGLARVGELHAGDLTQTSFASLQSTQLDFRGDSDSDTALDPRYGNRNILLLSLTRSAHAVANSVKKRTSA